MFENILKYQKLDLQLIRLEKKLNESAKKKVVTDMVSLVKELQGKTVKLENDAKIALAKLDNLKNSYSKQFEEMEKLSKVSVESMSEEELDKHIEKLNALNNSLQATSRELTILNDHVQKTVFEFEQTKKKVVTARQKHKDAKVAYEKEVNATSPEIEKIKAELASIKVEDDLLKKYNQLKNDKIMPVFIQVRDDCCGACMQKLPTSQLNKLKEAGKLECEHCHRIIIA